MERVFQEWPSHKREFIGDFQGAGFSARVWELALFAYFSEREYAIELPGSPDFIVKQDGTSIAVEATTSNESRSDQETIPLSETDVEEDQAEFLFQLAKILRSKVNRVNAEGQRYWELPKVKGLPFVLAIHAFHANRALWFGDSTLASYLFGLTWEGEHDNHGSAVIRPSSISGHRFRDKTIPSGFFNRAEHRCVSAIIFSNAATISQFQRIAIEHRMGVPSMQVHRIGVCYDPDPNALVPAKFAYEPEAGIHRETFAQGIRVLHNPNALTPLDPNFMTDVSHMMLSSEGLVEVRHPAFVPFASLTTIMRTREST
jgi:hypothetical protein